MCHTLLEIPKKRANINHWLLFMKVINVSLSALLLVARFGEGSLVCVHFTTVSDSTPDLPLLLSLSLVRYLLLQLFVILSENMTSPCPLTHIVTRALIG